MAFVIALLVFLTTLLLFQVLRRRLQRERLEIAARLEHYVEQGGGRQGAQGGLPPDAGARQVFRWLGGLLESPRWSKKLERSLAQGGVPLRSGEFLLVCLGAAGAGLLLGLLLQGPALGAAACLLGGALPPLVLRLKIQRRARAFNGQLGNALVLIANSLRAGHSFFQAIGMVAKEMPPPISEEFARVLRELRLGVATETAMTGMAQRVASDDLELVVTAVLIQRQVGGNLAEILEKAAATIRERVRVRGQVRTLTAQGRISGMIVGLLPFALGLAIQAINPGYLSALFTQPVGKMLLAVGLASQVLGILVIRKIVDIEL